MRLGKSGLIGLSAHLKDKLIQQSLERRLKQAGLTERPQAQTPTGAPPAQGLERPDAVRPNQLTPTYSAMGHSHKMAPVAEEFYRFDRMPGYKQIQIIHSGAQRMGLVNPFFKQHDGLANAHTQIAGRDLINFSSYNYLNLSGDARINAAAVNAIEKYGTSVSASRLVSGERQIHRELETALAALYEADDAIVFVSGHATNVTTIGHLFGPRDLVVHDEYIHNSALEGIKLSGAKRFSFQHNNWQALDQLLTQHRSNYERVLVVIEGIYSMDGDYPDLPRFVEIRNRHKVFLMVDEAHSLGVMGARGHGIREHFGLQTGDVDLWMGTLSKTLAGCGGYIAGESALIDHLKYLAPGFLYSVGMSPPLAAASLAALQCLTTEQPRVAALQERGKYFLQLAQAAGVNTGTSSGLAVVPAIIGSSIRATRLSSALLTRGINVQPILYPAVPEKSARLRFFMSCQHTEQEIEYSVSVLTEEIKNL
jgi:8-amino-7-oxononanoate synthase